MNWVVIALSCCLLTASGCATNSTVIVRDATGNELRGVMIYLTDASLLSLIKNNPQLLVTNANGEARFKAKGSIRLQIVKPGMGAKEYIIHAKNVIVLSFATGGAMGRKVHHLPRLSVGTVSASEELIADWNAYRDEIEQPRQP